MQLLAFKTANKIRSGRYHGLAINFPCAVRRCSSFGVDSARLICALILFNIAKYLEMTSSRDATRIVTSNSQEHNSSTEYQMRTSFRSPGSIFGIYYTSLHRTLGRAARIVVCFFFPLSFLHTRLYVIYRL